MHDGGGRGARLARRRVRRGRAVRLAQLARAVRAGPSVADPTRAVPPRLRGHAAKSAPLERPSGTPRASPSSSSPTPSTASRTKRGIGTYRPAWIACAVINAAYSYYWDVTKDWGSSSSASSTGGAATSSSFDGDDDVARSEADGDETGPRDPRRGCFASRERCCTARPGGTTSRWSPTSSSARRGRISSFAPEA